MASIRATASDLMAFIGLNPLAALSLWIIIIALALPFLGTEPGVGG